MKRMAINITTLRYLECLLTHLSLEKREMLTKLQMMMMMELFGEVCVTSIATTWLLATWRGDVVADAAVAAPPSTHLDLHPIREPLGGAAGPVAVVQLPVFRYTPLVAMEECAGSSS